MNKTRISVGNDPRGFTEFSQIRDEISKLTHPARPDVDWLKAEQLSLSLFRTNGVELQTLAWYTVARIHNAGLAGLAEGAELLDALLTHHWTGLWPQPTHARVEVLAWLSARLQQELRTFTLAYADLPQVYRVEQSLKHGCEVLQKLELKTLSKLETVAAWMHNAALRLEKAEAENGVAGGDDFSLRQRCASRRASGDGPRCTGCAAAAGVCGKRADSAAACGPVPVPCFTCT